MDNLRNTIATKVLSNIPPRVKPIDYLMEALTISRESVYRRIRGDISFTFEEIAKLSVDLGFSIDELIIQDMNSRVFFDLHTNGEQNPSEIFGIMMQQYLQCAFDAKYGKDIETIKILNYLPLEFTIVFDHLYQFSYYRWMHQHQEASLKYFYSDAVLPEKLIRLQHRATENLKKIRNNMVILDPFVFLNPIREIQYYYKRKLINDEELSLIKNNLLGLVDLMENIAQTGGWGSEVRYDFYLLALNVESSSVFSKCEDQFQSLFFINSMEPIIVTHPNVCTTHKKWLDSMRKYATLITQSNEILQVRYFNMQRSHIMRIEDTSAALSL